MSPDRSVHPAPYWGRRTREAEIRQLLLGLHLPYTDELCQICPEWRHSFLTLFMGRPSAVWHADMLQATTLYGVRG